MTYAPSYVPPARPIRCINVRTRHHVTAGRIRFALLTGPFALKGHKHNRTLLIERCEEIPGADVNAVRTTLRAMIESGTLRTDGLHYWRAA